MLGVKNYRPGFSLIDLLITVIVIGVAGSVILKFFTNYKTETQKNVAQSQTIKEYAYGALWESEFQKLSQATSMILINNNNSLENLCSGSDQNKCMMEKYSQTLSAMSSCTDSVKGKCWHNNGEWFLGDKTPSTENIDAASGLILNNGVFVLFNNVDTTCLTGTCGQIYVDVNGFGIPNRIGNDIFKINILKNSISKANM